jgi:diguanylate cyclase (GGDEF)-like protein/PAS domain S-box-containing protein
MSTLPIRLLLAEDNPADVELGLRELRRAGLQIAHQIADTEEAFAAALRGFAPDIVLSDFSMPSFDGMQALRLTREISPDTPFIFVSGTLGEDYAIRALKNGATDYVLKTNLVRLPASIERALVEAKERRARQRAEAGLRRAQVMAKLAHVITAPGGAFESWSDSLPPLIGVEPQHMPRTTREWLDILHPDDRELFRRKSIEADETGTRVDVDYRLRRDDGVWIHVRQAIEPLGLQAGADQSSRWFNTLQDVTDQKQAEEAVTRLNRVYAMLSGVNALIVRARSRDELFRDACRIAVEDGKFPLAWIGLVDQAKALIEPVAWDGDAAEDYLSKMPMAMQGEGMAGRAVREGIALIANDVESDPQIVIKDEALARGFRSLVVLPLRVAGTSVGVMALYAEQRGFFDDQEMKLLNELAGDISFAIDHIGKAEKLEYLAYFNPLTGLANRMLLMDRLAQALAANPAGSKVALALVNIERFKTINDTLGRKTGDALLAQMAQRLVGLAGDPSRVAHIGGDQFCVMIPGVKIEEKVARIIEDGFARVEGAPFRPDGAELRIAIRSGIALYPNDGADADSIFRNAEAALKKAKSSGEKYLFYTEKMTERIAERLSFENKLRHAIEKEEFVLHYQPKVDVAHRRIVGVEALIRWQGPDGLIPPLSFIPLLEETGLITQVGAWALKRALLDHRRWTEQGLPAPRVAVNVSPLQLRQRNFVDVVGQAIASGAAPAGLDLELTESLIMEDIEANIGKLNSIRGLGVNIAIDDFGTGYSSLGYLARLPVQALKIDRSFISAMDKDPNAMTLVATIISLAHSLHLKVIAEGVETESQANTLRGLQCDELQGYLFSKPLPIEGITALLRKGI